MPKKKTNKTKPNQAVPMKKLVDDNGKGIDEIPDAETVKKMREQMIDETPELRHMFQYMDKLSEDRTKQAQDSSLVVKNERGIVTQELLLQYPNSPTAKYTMKALNHYMYAINILWNYPKQRVLSQSDCDSLQPALHHFAEGYMIAQYMVEQFILPPSFEDLVEDYLKLRPRDILVEYVYVKAVVAMKTRELTDYERCKETIRAFEKFAHKLLPYKHEDTAKRILIDTYYMLGAKYSTTDQDERALEAFEKCYALDETNVGALYSVAFLNKMKDPERALKLCKKYLDMAPKCDVKFPNVHYVMGYIYARHFKDIKLAKKYYHLGKKAETFRLPFNTPTDFNPKSFLESIIPIAESNTELSLAMLEHD